MGPIVSYTATAGQTDFTLTFPFINEGHLRVEINGVITDDWTLLDDTTIRLGIVQILVEGDNVQLYRQTPVDRLLVTFSATAPIRSTEMSIAFRQMIYAIEELELAGQATLLKALSGTHWLGEGIPLRELGEPDTSDSAATKAYVDNALAGDGILPTPSVEDIGKGVLIRGGGGGPTYSIGSIEGSVYRAQVPDDNSGLAGGILGYPVVAQGTGTGVPWTIQDLRVPLAFREKIGDPENGSIAVSSNGFDLVIPRGVYEITVEGNARSLTNSNNVNFNSVAAALTSVDGATIHDKADFIVLGASGGANSGSPSGAPKFPFQASAFIKLTVIVSLTASAGFNLRASKASSADDVVLDRPFRVSVREIAR